MMSAIRIGLVLAAALLLAGRPLAAQVLPPENGAYHSAFVDERGFPSTVDAYKAFESLTGKSLAIAMLYRSWSMFPRLDVLTMLDLHEAGFVPHITWEPWWGNPTDQTYSNQRILDGRYDAYLQIWAEDIKAFGHPVMIRWAHEMNGNWYPWSGIHSGGARTDGFGDPAKADGPERYVAAYRYIHDTFAMAGVTNVSWLWCPEKQSVPNEPWNQPEEYYPGDDVVDWVCLDGYNWGAATYDWGVSGWMTFIQLFKPIYDRVKVYQKPVMIGEFASAEVGGDKGQWISDAYAAMRSPAFGLIKAVTWFHIDKETDWRVNSSERALNAYRQALSHPHYLGNAMTTSHPEEIHAPRGQTRFETFPNPTSGVVSARLTTASPAELTIRIYDLLGRLIAERSLGFLPPGDHRLADLPAPAAPGLFLVRLEDAARNALTVSTMIVQ
jgi:beta-mannanase